MKLLHHSYTNSHAFITYQGEQSDICHVRQGVFLVFINDFITALRQANSGICVFGLDIPLQEALDTVHSYASKWGLTYNPSKSNVVVFSKTKQKVLDINLVM